MHRRAAGSRTGANGPAAMPGQPTRRSLAPARRGATFPAAWTPSGNRDGCHRPPQPTAPPDAARPAWPGWLRCPRLRWRWFPGCGRGRQTSATLLSCQRGPSRYPAGRPDLRRAGERRLRRCPRPGERPSPMGAAGPSLRDGGWAHRSTPTEAEPRVECMFYIIQQIAVRMLKSIQRMLKMLNVWWLISLTK